MDCHVTEIFYLQQSTKIVAGVDIGFGVLTAILVGAYLGADGEAQHSVRIESHGRHYKGGWHYTALSQEQYIVMGAAAIAQVIMGAVLLVGAVNKSRAICWAWMITTFVGVFMTLNFFIRIYMMVVVGAFMREMRRESEVSNLAGRPSHPKTQLQVLQVHQPPPPIMSTQQHLQQGMWIPPQQQQQQQHQQLQQQQQQQQLGFGLIENKAKFGNVGVNGHPQVPSQQMWEKS